MVRVSPVQLTSRLMHTHPNARLTPLGREPLLRRHIEEHLPLPTLATQAGISLRTAYAVGFRSRQPAAAVIWLDTNVLTCYFVEGEAADMAIQTQRQAARQLIESGQDLFLPKTVALELEWVLRGYDGFAAEQVLQVFEQLLQHPCLQLEDRHGLEQVCASAWISPMPCITPVAVTARRSPRGHGFARRIRQLNLPPRVLTPSAR